MRTTIRVQGARQHNLRNVELEIPRDQLVVFTGVSGSGKSSLAFDTIYAEGQRRYLESLSAFVRNFVAQVQKPDVDFVYGLSPVVSIGQKTVSSNPRSTVGTMTDIAGYLNLLFATLGTGVCLRCARPLALRTPAQIAESVMNLPEGTRIEIRAPVLPIYGEDLSFLATEIRKRGYRRLAIDGTIVNLSDEIELDEAHGHEYEVAIDRFEVSARMEKPIRAALDEALSVGERYVSVVFEDGTRLGGGCPEHGYLMGGVSSEDFIFNNPKSACRTCLGLGATMKAHRSLIIPDPSRSIIGGCFVREAFKYNKDTYDGKLMYSLSKFAGFSLDVPFKELDPAHADLILFGTHGEKFPLLVPDGTSPDQNTGRLFKWDGIMTRIERYYRRYRQQETTHTDMEDYLQKVMVEVKCPDCEGARLRRQRLNIHVQGCSVFAFGEMHIGALLALMQRFEPQGPRREAGRQILSEIEGRLDMLAGIGLDYLNLNRRSSTLSGGESQRIRLSTQVGSGLMGMMYVLDEPSIGLHPKDTQKLIATLHHLRDIGNSVIVVEHDEETIRAADWVVEMGPGAGVHGGEVVCSKATADFLADPAPLTSQFLSGDRAIPVPKARRAPGKARLKVVGASENNLRNLDVEIPLGLFVAVTGASGSGKSSLINEIVYKRLHAELIDSRTIPGAHRDLLGIEHVAAITRIDQSPIGRTPRSNPATYVGFYDDIRKLFAEQPLSAERGYTAARFSFNVKGGRCEECAGAGTVTEKLSFMPDVESICEACKGKRFGPETLEVMFQGKTISDILDMPIEEGVVFFAGLPSIARRIAMLHELGLGYLTLGQSATTLSGGEAQRVKLASELSKLRRGGKTLYILDEPTTGLHFADIERLLECLNRLVEAGNSVIVIEHHMDVVKCADWVLDLGPEGGHGGGELIVAGTPEDVAACHRSHTGRFLKRYL